MQTTGVRSNCFSVVDQIVGARRPPSFDPNESLQRLEKRRRAVLMSAYASCWRHGDESEAMWRLYLSGKEGVAISSTYGKLQEAFAAVPSIVVSPIEYLDYEKDAFTRNEKPWDPALHKRTAFEHEQGKRFFLPTFPR